MSYYNTALDSIFFKGVLVGGMRELEKTRDICSAYFVFSFIFLFYFILFLGEGIM